uniref:Flavin-containing monooxygenase n=1 Tax=Romanomermis culicivorax TaxID=13658 RepID=A0A915K378_ROMCU
MKVAIIGAGVSGLICIKVCKDYGFDIVCFEKTNDIGGLWRYKDEDYEGQASVMKSTIINTSKELMAFSDYPPPAEFPNFMHNTKVLEYTQMYAKHFDLLSYIKFCHEVTSVKKDKNYTQNGKWNVHYAKKDNEQEVQDVEIFDAVFVAIGHHVYPHVPHFDGIENFKGRVIHSHAYKHQKSYHDRKAVVVGIGNSGGDIAVELALRRIVHYLAKYVSMWPIKRFVEWQANLNFDHELYGLACDHEISAQHPMVNDELPNRIMSGGICIKPDIKSFLDGNTILFKDGSTVTGVNDVILCTGYDISFPIIDQKILEVKQNRVDTLYKNIFPINLEHATLFFIGLVQPIGAIAPISEMQARLCCEVLCRNVILPNVEKMTILCRQEHEKVYKRYVESRRHTIQVDYIEYTDNLAELIHAKPNWLKILFKDPKLAWTLFFAPTAPYQYRLQGPQSWPGAREALLTIWDRTFQPLKSGRCYTRKRSSSKMYLICIFLVFSIIVIWYFLL